MSQIFSRTRFPFMSRRRVLFSFTAMAALFLVSPMLGAQERADSVPQGREVGIDGVAAVVGNQVVLVSDLLKRVNLWRAQGRQPRDSAEFIMMQRAALDTLIEEELLVQRARAESIMVNEAEVEQQVDAHEKQVLRDFTSEAAFRNALRQAGFSSLEEWRRQQSEDLRRRFMQRDLYMKLRREGKIVTVNVSEREVTQAFEENKEYLPRKEARIGMRQLVLPTLPSDESKAKARALADSLRAQLVQNPDDFESFARRYSMDAANKDLGGDLGWNRRGRLVPEFDRVMFALNPGVISPVVETVFGYHIIKVDRVQTAEVKARHILIRADVDSADEARTLERAKQVADAWRKGANYDSLAAAHHDQVREDKSIPDFPRDSLPESYRNAIEGHVVGDIVDPFPIEDPSSDSRKFVILEITKLEEAGEYTFEELRDRIRMQLSEERTMRRFIDSLKETTYVAIKFDPAVPRM